MTRKLLLLLTGLGLLLAAACAREPAAGPGRPERDVRPPCDDPAILARIVEQANTQADLVGRLPARVMSLDGIRETRVLDRPELSAFQRLCVGDLILASGESVAIGWEIFSAETSLGTTYGLRACFGPYDPAEQDCSAFARGQIPGEP